MDSRWTVGWWTRIDEVDPSALREGIVNLVHVYRGHATLMAEHIRRGQEAGTVRAELDSYLTAGWIVWMVERGLHQMVRGVDDAEADAQANELVRVLWNLLYEPHDRAAESG